MPISSLIIQVGPGRADTVGAAIADLPHASVAGRQGDALVVITDTASRRQDKDLLDRLENLPGVLALDAIYHNFEDIAAAEYREGVCQAPSPVGRQPASSSLREPA